MDLFLLAKLRRMQVVLLVQVLLLSVPVSVSARSVKALLKQLPVSRKRLMTFVAT